MHQGENKQHQKEEGRQEELEIPSRASFAWRSALPLPPPDDDSTFSDSKHLSNCTLQRTQDSAA